MDEAKWHCIWEAVLLSRGFTRRQAHHIFFTRYGEGGVDLAKDPVKEAMRVVKPHSEDAYRPTYDGHLYFKRPAHEEIANRS